MRYPLMFEMTGPSRFALCRASPYAALRPPQHAKVLYSISNERQQLLHYGERINQRCVNIKRIEVDISYSFSHDGSWRFPRTQIMKHYSEGACGRRRGENLIC